MEEYAFDIDPILMGGEYRRVITSGFLHVGWIHFGFNMIALLSFSAVLEDLFGFGKFFALYFISMIGGNLLALYIHRNHGDYSAVGASGAISGVILSYCVIYPNAEISFILIPIGFKAWMIAILFVVISIFGIKSQRGNIGHEAHLGGGIIGVLLTPFFIPTDVAVNWWVMLAILVPTTFFLLLIVKNPAVMMIRNYWGENVRDLQTSFKKAPPSHADRQAELDQLLDKIRQKGYDSLSQKERNRFEDLKDEV